MPTLPRPSPLAMSLALGALALLSAHPAQAQTVSDSFEYPTGNLNGRAGGTGFTGAWSSTGTQVTSPGLAYPGLATAGNAVTLSPFGANTPAIASRQLASTFGADGTTLYISFLDQATNTGSRFLGVSLFSGNPGPSGTANGTEQLFIGKLNGTSAFGVSSGAASASSQTSSSMLSLLVARIDFATGTDTVTLYVNPTVGAPEPTPSATLNNVNIGTFNYLRLAAGAGNSMGTTTSVTGRLDELRLGDTFASVTPAASAAAAPEPSQYATLGLCLLGLGALILKARKRQAA